MTATFNVAVELDGTDHLNADRRVWLGIREKGEAMRLAVAARYDATNDARTGRIAVYHQPSRTIVLDWRLFADGTYVRVDGVRA